MLPVRINSASRLSSVKPESYHALPELLEYSVFRTVAITLSIKPDHEHVLSSGRRGEGDLNEGSAVVGGR